MSREEQERPREERASEIVADKLAEQLGTEPYLTEKGRYDMRLLSNIEREDIALVIFGDIRSRKTRVWRLIVDDYLRLLVSVGGRGRRDIIRMAGVAKGGMPSVSEEIPKPSILARNIWDRGWRKKREEERI